MTPQDLAALTALVALLEKIGTWPLITIGLLIVVGPWIAVFILNRGQEKRHAEVVKMYEDNVVLVQSYDKHVNHMEDRDSELLDAFRLNTAASSGLKTFLETRPRCNILKGNGQDGP